MESRQVQRAEARRQAKRDRSQVKTLMQMDAQRALRERTRRRSYDNPFSLFLVMKGSRSRVSDRQVRKGEAFGRILFESNGRAYHATRGWKRA